MDSDHCVCVRVCHQTHINQPDLIQSGIFKPTKKEENKEIHYSFGNKLPLLNIDYMFVAPKCVQKEYNVVFGIKTSFPCLKIEKLNVNCP